MLEYDRGLATLDWCVLGVFTVECVVKIGAEGAEWWRYFVGPEWRWNNFDFTIVVACMPGISDQLGNVSFLRLMRLARIAKIVKKVPQLRMIVTGLIGGLESIGCARALSLLLSRFPFRWRVDARSLSARASLARTATSPCSSSSCSTSLRSLASSSSDGTTRCTSARCPSRC